MGIDSILVLAQQRYVKSHRILANCRAVKDFRRFRNSQTGLGLAGQFWGLDSHRILKLVLREIILSQEIQMPQAAADPWAIACSNSSRLAGIIDLGEFLRQIQVIPADDAILDQPFAGFGHLLVFLLRLQEFAWIADRDRALEGVDMLVAAEHLKSPLHAAPHKRLPGCGPECGDLRRFLWDFTYLCWANP